jgi:hypothetical protein
VAEGKAVQETLNSQVAATARAARLRIAFMGISITQSGAETSAEWAKKGGFLRYTPVRGSNRPS